MPFSDCGHPNVRDTAGYTPQHKAPRAAELGLEYMARELTRVTTEEHEG
jgi:hypothetical protein